MNKITNLILTTAAILMLASCGTAKKATTDTTTHQTTTTTPTGDRRDAILATVNDWKTMEGSGKLTINVGKAYSSSFNIRMVRDDAIFVSIRPLLGIEVARLLFTGDSIYGVDKIHKRYVAEKVSILTNGAPVTVSIMQDIFLGRPFIIGKGTYSYALKNNMTVLEEQQNDTVMLVAQEQYEGYGHAFSYDKNNRLLALDIVPTGGSKYDYLVHYGNIIKTVAGNIAHTIKVNAVIDNNKFAFHLNYNDDIEWNDEVKIDRNIPKNYKRVGFTELFKSLDN